MATAWLFHDSLVRQALLSHQHSCYRVNLCHLIGLIITFHQRYWSVSPLLKGMGEEKRGNKTYQENMNMKEEEEGHSPGSRTLLPGIAPNVWCRVSGCGDWLSQEEEPYLTWSSTLSPNLCITHPDHTDHCSAMAQGEVNQKSVSMNKPSQSADQV